MKRMPCLPALLAGIACAAGIAACRDEEPERPAERAEAGAPAAAVVSPAFTTVTDAMLTGVNAASQDWLIHGGAYNNQRYSALNQITRENVAGLVPVWIHQTGIAESFATTPLVVDNTMYLSTPESHVVALNAVTGERLWEFIPLLETVTVCCGPENRGVAVYGDRVYVGTLDARVIALNNRTGEVVWETALADPEDGYSVTMAPLAYAGKVVVGVDGGEYGIRGFVVALDAETGKEVWRWHTIPAPGQGSGGWWGEWKDATPFGTSLHRDIAGEQENRGEHLESWKRGGGGVRTTPAYDPTTQMLYLVVGHPAPSLDGRQRPGDNLYTGSIVALDGSTGELKWHFQYLPHDVWGLSGGSPPFLFEGAGGRYVGHAANVGWLYVLDAATGRPVLRSENFVPQDNLFAPPTDSGTWMLPGADGGNGGSPVAYSPRTRLAYVLGLHQPMVYTRRFEPKVDGRLWLGGSFRYTPDQPQWGVISAIDTRTGRIVWQRQLPDPAMGGALVTAGDVLFIGESSGTLDAFDAVTGELLWQFHTGAGVNAAPITYMVNGVQYVAVASGGNYQLDTPRGDNLIVFALHSNQRTVAPRSYPAPRYRRVGAIRYGEVRQVPAAQLEASRNRRPAPAPRR
ncbi:MAG TPA: PQQ-binding-like beta-propeller repeat protein [Longimicrobiales bacterium]